MQNSNPASGKQTTINESFLDSLTNTVSSWTESFKDTLSDVAKSTSGSLDTASNFLSKTLDQADSLRSSLNKASKLGYYLTGSDTMADYVRRTDDAGTTIIRSRESLNKERESRNKRVKSLEELSLEGFDPAIDPGGPPKKKQKTKTGTKKKKGQYTPTTVNTGTRKIRTRSNRN